MNKSELNMVCGKCHFDKLLMKGNAVTPDGRHGVFMSVGYDNGKYKRQLACLDCHGGHATKREMLNSIKAHACFSCHKEAIVTMGIFQPINYLALGKACQACHSIHGGPTVSQAARLGIRGFIWFARGIFCRAHSRRVGDFLPYRYPGHGVSGERRGLPTLFLARWPSGPALFSRGPCVC